MGGLGETREQTNGGGWNERKGQAAGGAPRARDITVRQYQNIESGKTMGKIALWDALEDLFGVHQRRLREVSGADG